MDRKQGTGNKERRARARTINPKQQRARWLPPGASPALRSSPEASSQGGLQRIERTRLCTSQRPWSERTGAPPTNKLPRRGKGGTDPQHHAHFPSAARNTARLASTSTRDADCRRRRRRPRHADCRHTASSPVSTVHEARHEQHPGGWCFGENLLRKALPACDPTMYAEQRPPSGRSSRGPLSAGHPG